MTLLYHFSTRVWPGLDQPRRNFELERALPYATAVVVVFVIALFRKHYIDKYQEFESNSPGAASK